MSKDRKRAERRKPLGEQYDAEQAERAAEEQAAAASRYRANTMATIARAATAARLGVDVNQAVANVERIAQQDQEAIRSREAKEALEEHLRRGLAMSRNAPLAVFDLDGLEFVGGEPLKLDVLRVFRDHQDHVNQLPFTDTTGGQVIKRSN